MIEFILLGLSLGIIHIYVTINTHLKKNPAGHFDALNLPIINVGTPTHQTHAATKDYTDIRLAKLTTQLNDAKKQTDRELGQFKEQWTEKTRVVEKRVAVMEAIDIPDAKRIAREREGAVAALETPFYATIQGGLRLQKDQLLQWTRGSGGTNHAILKENGDIYLKTNDTLLFELLIKIHDGEVADPEVSYLDLTTNTNWLTEIRFTLSPSQKLIYHSQLIHGNKQHETISLFLSPDVPCIITAYLKISPHLFEMAYMDPSLHEVSTRRQKKWGNSLKEELNTQVEEWGSPLRLSVQNIDTHVTHLNEFQKETEIQLQHNKDLVTGCQQRLDQLMQKTETSLNQLDAFVKTKLQTLSESLGKKTSHMATLETKLTSLEDALKSLTKPEMNQPVEAPTDT